MHELRSYLEGTWRVGDGDPIVLENPATSEPLAQARSVAGLGPAVAHGRDVGGAQLRRLSIGQRGRLLSDLGQILHDHREELIGLAVANGGNTRGDAKFDIDGAAAVLAAYAELAGQLGDGPWIVDGDAAPIIRSGKIRAQQVLLPRRGIAVHINAFNFPAWGMVGKLAVALLAGMPVLSKPATSSALLAWRIAELFIASGKLPEGSFQLLIGPAGDLLDHLGPQDVVAFTGSASTGARIRGHRTCLSHNVRVNIEADSLNAAIIGPDVTGGSELFDLIIRDAVVELTQKAGQKCTATRRILVPSALLDLVREALVERLNEIAARTGDPADAEVRMGPLATGQQLRDARAGITRLQESARIVRGDARRDEFVGVPPQTGYFLEPILLESSPVDALDPKSSFHRIEVFGPVATLLPYDGSVERAARIVASGEGSLVSTLYSDDRSFTHDAVIELAPHLGRLVLAGEKIAGASLPPGCVFPQVVHGGPGRAGAGEELGGRAGLELYLQRTSLQGGASQLARLLGTGS